MSTVPARDLGIGGHLARRLRPLVVAIGVLIGVGPPATYYVFERLALQNTGAIYAETFAGRLRDVVAENPGLWKYSGQKHALLLSEFLVQRDIASIEILDERGLRLGGSADLQAHGRGARWRAPVGSAPIRYNARAVGSVRVEISHAHLLGTTAAFAALFAMAGVGLAVLVYRFPVRVVRVAERRIEELLSSLDQRVKETDALLEIARATESSTDADELFRTIAHGALATCGADICGVGLLDDSGRRVRLVATVRRDGSPGASRAEPVECAVADVPLVEETIRGRKPVVLREADGDPRLPRDWLCESHAAFTVPLGDRNRTVGILLLGYAAGGRPTAADVRVATALADQVALALHHVFLIEHLSRTVEQLRAKNAELDSFVYSVSHDLKAPLVSLQGLAGLLLQDHGPQLDDEGRHHLERIMYNSSHMERLLMDVLALSRVGREGREPEVVDLRAMVDEIEQRLAETIRRRRITLVIGHLTPLVGVRTRIEQIMANLIGNAVKYVGDTPGATIEIGNVARDGFVEVWVRDTGIGIDAAYHEKIFQPFQRLEDIDAPGSGLGLAIVKKIVETAGGRVWVESAREAGATFRFTWPVPPGKSTPRAA
jgi:signal transduction histidine kinase